MLDHEDPNPHFARACAAREPCLGTNLGPTRAKDGIEWEIWHEADSLQASSRLEPRRACLGVKGSQVQILVSPTGASPQVRAGCARFTGIGLSGFAGAATTLDNSYALRPSASAARA